MVEAKAKAKGEGGGVQGRGGVLTFPGSLDPSKRMPKYPSAR